jgi:hypothetical protein
MPVAHQTGSSDYAPYYFGPNYSPNYEITGTVFGLAAWFNRDGCEGISLRRATAAPAERPDELWDLYAFTDGFLSYQNDALVLRLPTELQAAAVDQYNSGRLYRFLRPLGPQLRHVVYAFDGTPGLSAESRIRALLADAAHPGRTLVRVMNGNVSLTLNQYLALAPENAERVLQEFMLGSLELFVRAGDVIGNFRNLPVEIRFLDSCGSLAGGGAGAAPPVPAGRAINPSYFLYQVRRPANLLDPQGPPQAAVTMLTSFDAAPEGNTRHPFEFFFDLYNTTVAQSGNPDQYVDPAAAHPPRPLLVTIPVQDAAGTVIAGRGIQIAALGDWHESRNAANPFNTAAPVRWRTYGTGANDNVFADRGRLVTEVKAGQVTRLPGGAAFDHRHVPTAVHQGWLSTYWTRYSAIFNAVADALELPCELLAAIACNETAGGVWYNAANFLNSGEMNITRLEPLSQQPAVITQNAASQVLLGHYATLTGGVGGAGGNATVPVPWSGGTPVRAGNPLTWNQLRDLMDDFPDQVRVSPGVMQSLVKSADEDMSWAAAIYGDDYLSGIQIQHNGVTLSTDTPPASLDDLFENWFAASVDAAGAATTVAANTDATLTRMKRALHQIVAGGCHIKRRYNTLEGGGANMFNMITDLDWPTVASGYNDAAGGVAAAAPNASIDHKWHRLFALRFYNDHYPDTGAKLYNAAVEYFNATPAPAPLPSVRLWTP